MEELSGGRVSRMVTWGGGLVLGAALLASLWLSWSMGGQVFAARIASGLAGCL